MKIKNEFYFDLQSFAHPITRLQDKEGVVTIGKWKYKDLKTYVGEDNIYHVPIRGRDKGMYMVVCPICNSIHYYSTTGYIDTPNCNMSHKDKVPYIIEE